MIFLHVPVFDLQVSFPLVYSALDAESERVVQDALDRVTKGGFQLVLCFLN